MFIDICCGFSKHYIIQVVINRISYDYTVLQISILILCCLVLQIYSNDSIRKVVSTTLGDIKAMPHPAVSPCAIEPEFEEVANSHFCNRRELNDMLSL